MPTKMKTEMKTKTKTKRKPGCAACNPEDHPPRPHEEIYDFLANAFYAVRSVGARTTIIPE